MTAAPRASGCSARAVNLIVVGGDALAVGEILGPGSSVWKIDLFEPPDPVGWEIGGLAARCVRFSETPRQAVSS